MKDTVLENMIMLAINKVETGDDKREITQGLVDFIHSAYLDKRVFKDYKKMGIDELSALFDMGFEVSASGGKVNALILR